MKRLGIVGARGYVGAELLRLLANHRGIELAVVSSRQLVGQTVRDHFENPSELTITDLGMDDIPADVDAWILALPNGHAGQWTEAIETVRPDAAIVDLSADFRFEDSWVYGLTERNREKIRTARRVSNPGCYATAIQVAVEPMLGLFESPPNAFGVSGYSGAGTTPSPKNDPELLRDNLMPYSLTGHVHEREVSRHLGHPVRFMPHVASFFRGISVTVAFELNRSCSHDEILERYTSFWHNEPLIRVSAKTPWVKDIAHQHHVAVGGMSLSENGRHLVTVATIDNLLKGAATQALQNLNLSLGFSELEGIS